MRTAKNSTKHFAHISSIYYNLRSIAKKLQFKNASTEAIFTNIYHGNKWVGAQSVSGTGSDASQTRTIIDQLPKLFSEHKIKSILDIPCGDFLWMKELDLTGIEYIGGDIVQDLINENQTNYHSDSVRFQRLNLLTDELPSANLVLCRDCLVHFSFDDIFKAIEAISNSGCEYFLTTTFADRTVNHNITTGDWRPINLEIAPFHFPKPIRLINEECMENRALYRDKSLGLWRIEELKDLNIHSNS
jgi:hypothetical protein